MTEYKGVPTLFVGEFPDRNDETMVVDFGNVRVGTMKSRTLYIKNRDQIIDGSVLEVTEVRTDPASSTNFQVQLDAELPGFLNQFSASCDSDAVCDQTLEETCDLELGVCRAANGRLKDIITATVDFVGTTPGPIDETLVLRSNSGGMGPQDRFIRLVANVTFTEINVDPDPIEFPETFLGYPQQRTVTISNGGTAPLTIDAIELADSSTFGLDLGSLTLPATVAAAGSISVEMAYAPTVAAIDETVLLIDSNDLAMPNLRVRVLGNALIAPEMTVSPGQIDFGDTHVQVPGQPLASQTVTVRNAGGSELRVSSIVPTTVTGTAVSVEPASLTPIPPGGEATFDVRYSPPFPSFPATQNELVQIASNDPTQQPLFELPISGRAVDPNLILVPSTPINFNTLMSNPNQPNIYFAQELTTTVSLVNGGVGPLRVTALSIGGDVSALSLQASPMVPVRNPAGCVSDGKCPVRGPGSWHLQRLSYHR